MPRLDQFLMAQGLCSSRASAQRAVKDGFVRVNGKAVLKPATNVNACDHVELLDPNAKWVSRGAQKLLAMIGDVKGKVALDLGASTGGFCQVLLEHGAAHVFAVDVGHGQLHEKLRDDPRITNIEGMNTKALDESAIEHDLWPNFEVISCDLSFISIRKALPSVLQLAPKFCDLYLLVKPQFELSPDDIGKGGIVKSEAARDRALQGVVEFLEMHGWKVAFTKPSPITGGDGNIEFLLAAQKVGT